MAQVKFKYGTMAQYNAITTKDNDTLYFITDRKMVYKGDDEYTSNIKSVVISTTGEGEAELKKLTITLADGSTVVYEAPSSAALSEVKKTLDGKITNHSGQKATTTTFSHVKLSNDFLTATAEAGKVVGDGSDGIGVARLRGGFYQGFFKTKCNEYQVLPTKIDDGITIEITLKKSNDVVNDKRTLNSVHPDNEGIFFFIGTRAENKWIKNYITEYSNADDNSNYVKDDYMKDNVFKKEATNEPYTSETDTSIDSEYLKPSEECKIGKYTSNGYSDKDYLNENDTCDIYNNYFINGYLADDEIINDDDFTTEEGYNIYQPNIEEIKTNNKFITYNRTKNGLDMDSDDGNTETILYNIKCPELENYFTLFNRTDNGYTIENIDSLLKVESKKYSVNKDIINNALCFRITSDGRLGYRYLTKDCDSEDGIGIIEEYTEQPLINNNVWYCISTKIQKCSNDKMKLSFYVNGKLKMITKEIPILDLRELNDLYSKQEGVPYNISVGGGTQGLCDVIYPLYRDNPSIIYPLEKYFAGSFIGDIKSFRFYSCLLNGNEIENNCKNDII